MKNNKYEIDMVNGSIMDKLISFALPLMISDVYKRQTVYRRSRSILR